MGVFFEREASKSSLANVLTDALLTEPPPNAAEADQQARIRAQGVLPVTDSVKVALLEAPPTPADAEKKASDQAALIADSLLGGTSFQTGRFVAALVIFLAVVGAAIGTDAASLTNSPATLYGFAGSIFGVVVGLLGGEKTAT